MKKSDLRTGDLVIYRNWCDDGVRKVMLNTEKGDILISKGGYSWAGLENFEEDMTKKNDFNMDIVMVYRPRVRPDAGTYELELCTLIYERVEKPILTTKEVLIQLIDAPKKRFEVVEDCAGRKFPTNSDGDIWNLGYSSSGKLEWHNKALFELNYLTRDYKWREK